MSIKALPKLPGKIETEKSKGNPLLSKQKNPLGGMPSIPKISN